MVLLIKFHFVFKHRKQETKIEIILPHIVFKIFILRERIPILISSTNFLLSSDYSSIPENEKTN